MPEEYNLGRLVASIALDSDGLDQDTRNANDRFNELDNSAKQLTEDTKKASDGFTVMKGVLSDLVSAGIKKASEAFINLAKDIVQTGQQFSTSMSEVQAISGATGSELEKLEQTAREFGATTKFSATEAADALKYMALAGWDAETSMAALPGVLDLAAASGMNLAAASDMVTDYLSAFGMEAEEASYMADLLTYAQGNSNTSAQQLGEAWKNCAANLNAAGQDVETVTSLLEAMANQGLKGSEAGTAVTAMMRDLTNKMDDGKITIGETSVTVQDAEGNFRDLTAILANVEQAVDGMGTAQRAAALSGTFTEESLKGLNLVLNEGVSNVSTYEEALRNSTGAAADAASTMSDNLSGDLKTMESAFEELKLKIFEDAEGPLRDIVQMVTRDGVPAVEALINNIDKLIPVVVSAAAAMGSYKAAIAIQSIVKGVQLGINELKNAKAASTAVTKAATAAEKLNTAEEQANKAAKQASAATEQANTAAKSANTAATQAGTASEQMNAATTQTSAVAKEAETVATEGATVAQEGLNVVMAANPIGLVCAAMSVFVTLLTTVVSAIANASTEVSKHTKAMIEATSAADKYTSTLKELEAKEGDIEANVAGENALIKEQQKEYDELRSKTELTANEKKRLATVAEELAETLGLTTEDIIDQTGVYKDLSKEIDTYIDKMTQAARAEYYADLIKESARTMESLKKPIEEAENNLNEFKEANKEVAAESLRIAKIQEISPEGVYIEVSEEVQAYRDRLQELSAELAGYKTEFREAEMKMNDASEEYKNAAAAADDLGKKTTGAASDTDTLTKSVTELTSAEEIYKKKLQDAKKEVADNSEAYKEQQKQVADLKKEIDKIEKDISEGKGKYSAADLFGKQQEYEEAKNNLINLQTEGTLLKNNVGLLKDEIEKAGKSGDDFLSELKSTAQQFASVQDEVKKNGHISIDTLTSITKKYPELSGLVDDYIMGVKTEQDVIKALKGIYENNVETYNEALVQKSIIQGNWLTDAVKNNAEIVNKFNEQYGVDLSNFSSASQAKAAILSALKQKIEELKSDYNKLWTDGYNVIGGSEGRKLTFHGDVIATSGSGETSWTPVNEAVRALVEGFASVQNEYFDTIDSYYNIDDEIARIVAEFYKPVSGDTILDLSKSNSSSSGKSGKSGSPTGSDGRTKYTTTVGYSWKGESYNASYDFYEGDDTSTLEADTRAKALLGLLDRVKSMGKVTAQEEISYLNDVLKTANLSADQQYEIRQRLYNAQKSFAENEKKAQEDALKAEYDRIEKSKNRGEISTKQEIAQLENIKKKFALTTEQKIALEEKLYDKRKQLREEEQKAQEEAIKAEYARIEKSRSRGEINTKQEIEQLEKIYKKYKLTTEQKAELDDKLYEKRKQLQEENLKAEYEQIEKKKSRNEISTKEEIAQLEKIYRKYKLTTEQKEELDEKLYEKRQQLRSEEISALDKLGDAVVTALKSKYAQQKELEEKRLDESVESWQKWEDETVNSIQGQIDALDELKEAHEEENKREEYENKRQALELELRYEKDDYNRKQIQKEIAALDKEENERLFSVQIEERKKALQEQQEEAKELSKAKQEEIQNTKAEMSARYDELMTDFALQGEAKKFILESSQDEITQLINSYASDYEMLGTTLGESLYNGISKKVNDIVAYVDSIAKKTDTQAERDKAAKALEKYVSSGAAQGSVKEPAVIPAANKVISFADSFSDILRRISESASLYKQQMSSVANSSAMHFYQTQRNYSTNSSTNSTRNSKTINVNTTVNFQKQVDSPAQMRRRLEEIFVDVAKQM